MGDHNLLKARYSFYGGETPRDSIHSESSWKSDVNVSKWLKPGSVSKCSSDLKNSSGEYLKKYEHDDVPVKDNNPRIYKAKLNNVEGMDSDRISLTNSDLQKLENKIYKNISQELQTDDSTISSLESNIKLFKTTVQEIFDNFYASMQDFEVYKKRFEEILAKNKEDSIADKEDFIKDMIHHILSSDTSMTNETCERLEMKDKMEIKAMGDASVHTNTTIVKERPKAKLLESLHSLLESYKNENYLTDSTFNDNSTKLNSSTKKEEDYNIYFLGSIPCSQIRINDRNILSEINIKKPRHRGQKEYKVASAENLNKLAEKKLEMEEHDRQSQDTQALDREIPVKVSFAKRNIYIDEDFSKEREKDENKSFISKICSYICKKLRRN